MAYTDINTPVIEQIKLPSGTSYYIADRQIRDVVAALADAVAGGVSFIVAWDGVTTPVVANIPAGVVVKYNGTSYTGTLAPEDSVPGAFYLVVSSTYNYPQDDRNNKLDVYDEYVVVKATFQGTQVKTWEKIGDTQIDLTDYVTAVSLSKQTDTVIGTDATFTITQPTVTLNSATSTSTNAVPYVSGITSASASGDSVTALTGLGTPSTDTFLKGVKVTAQPTVTLTANAQTATGRITYLESQGTAQTTKISASASGTGVSASGDNVTVITGLGTASTQKAVKSVTPTTKKLGVTTVTGVSGSTTPSVIQGRTSQTTATGGATSSTTNSDWIKGMSVTSGVLTFGAATMATQTTYSANAPGTITIPTAASSATTVATGSVVSSGTGADIVTDVSVGDQFDAVTGYAAPNTDTVLGTSSSFTVTQPTITIASGTTGDVTVATGIGAATTKYLSASASGTTVGANGTGSAVTGYASPSTDTVLGTGSTITVTPTTKYLTATATGANTAWNSKDSVTVLKSTTDVSVTKGTVS